MNAYRLSQESGKVHKQFSSETVPSVWKILPAIENFMHRWEELSLKPEYEVLRTAIECGIKTTEKYFSKAARSSAQIMNLCK